MQSWWLTWTANGTQLLANEMQTVCAKVKPHMRKASMRQEAILKMCSHSKTERRQSVVSNQRGSNMEPHGIHSTRTRKVCVCEVWNTKQAPTH